MNRLISKRKSLLLVSIALLAFSLFNCKRSKNGYEQTKSGLEYKYIIKKDTARKVQLNEYMVIDVKYFTDHDSLLFTTQSISGKFRMKYKSVSNNGDINEALGMMHIGDSISFKVDAKTFFTNTRHDSCPPKLVGTKLRFEIALHELQTETIVKELKKELTIVSVCNSCNAISKRNLVPT